MVAGRSPKDLATPLIRVVGLWEPNFKLDNQMASAESTTAA
jgi:hypothetical protein